MFYRKNRITPILQDESHECILACLAMIYRFHGGSLKLSDLRVKYPMLGRGGTLRDMIEIARALHLSSRALRVEIGKLEELRLPCVIHWNFNHFVVLEKIEPNVIHILDPAIGRRSIDRHTFSQHYTGIALELIPMADFYQTEGNTKESEGTSFFALFPFEAYGKPIAQFILLSLVVLIFALFSPLVIQIVVDEVIVKDDQNLLLVVGGVFLLANSISALSSYLLGVYTARQSALTRISFTHEYLDRLLSHHWIYFARRGLGSFVAQYNSLHFLVNFIVKNIGTFISDTLFVTILSILLFFISPTTASVVLILNILVVFVRLLLLNPIRSLQSSTITNQAQEEAYFVESMRGVSSVKANMMEWNRISGNMDKTLKSVNSSFKLALFNLRYDFFINMVKSIEVMAVLYLLARSVMSAQMTIGVMYAFYSYRQFLEQRLGSLIEAMSEMLNMKVHKDRLMEAFETDSSLLSALNVGHFMKFEGKITLKNIVFKIDNRKKTVIDDFSALAPRGSFIHIKGPTGSGKTTLIKLILNTLMPDAGEVLIDDIPITPGNISILRNSVGVVLQEDLLFKGTILENVALFDEHIHMARVEECCRLCLIHEDIMKLPLRYQSEVGDLGSNLSTGQQQRLLLARALYKQPTLLILDEATANLNEDMEKHILHNLKSLGKTVIFSSHSRHVQSFADEVWSVG